MKSKAKMKETAMKIVFLIAACVSVFAVALICVFLFANGIPAMKEIGFGDFLLGQTWKPGSEMYGILPFILGSIYVTAGAIILGVPIAILTSVFMAYYCPKKLYRPLKSGINLMAGVPSVVYGFFGLVLLVPLIKDTFVLRSGSTMLTASILLAIMILPTVVGVIEPALESVPKSYYEGALALGASHSKSVFFYDRSGCQVRYRGGRGSGNRPRRGRDHGRDYGCGKQYLDASGTAGGRPYNGLPISYWKWAMPPVCTGKP